MISCEKNAPTDGEYRAMMVKKIFRISKENIYHFSELMTSYEHIGIVHTLSADWPDETACIECLVSNDFMEDFRGIVDSVKDRYRVFVELDSSNFVSWR